LCQKLCAHGLGEVQVYVGENLSYENEKITCGTAEELSNLEFPPLSVMMILNAKANDFEYAVHGLDDELFMRSKVPMTKQEVRSVSMSKLQPEATDLIYDIGAGTGSCSIELALLAKKGKVWAFERNPVAVELLGKNKELFAVDNLEVVAGEALENIKAMPAPDCVFVGGSGGDLCDMLDVIYQKNPVCRVVINAITIETLAEVAAYYNAHKDYELEVVNVFAARSKKLGNYNLMMAQNPVYVMTALKKED
ncbi:MAG: precorrin-6Y C5,15-methyltransferase (decarboxylating) subunit CbiT, partial [Phascolarctobacterium sp.]|nr:precorrin-6Y C5,15-methyltransferase (decarboxylating) subunit CbiT [Phascolarctobacterium sp.]